MNIRKITKIFLIGILLVGVVAISIINVHANSQGGSNSLVDAPMQDIKQAALDYTQARFQVLSEDVTIPLARSVTDQDLPSLGISKMNFMGEDPPMALVALKGEFDVQNLGGLVRGNKPRYAKYIVYIFDLKAGAPCSIMVSPDGSGFRILLNDPSLPEGNIFGEDLLWAPEAGVSTLEPVIAPEEKLPYGAMAPEVPTPSDSLPQTEP